jgi:predicted MFS family arabinose efflux permease
VANALSFLGVILVIAGWKRPARKSKLPPETLRGATSAAIRYVRYSPGIRALLVRTACLVFFTSSFWALLPIVARDLKRGPIAYGLLLGFFGAGAVLGAVALPRAKAKLSMEAIVSIATAAFAAVLLSTAALRSVFILCILMLLGGAAWTVFMSLFNTIIQNLAPDWVRARVLAVYILVFQGSVVLGSTLWGLAAEHSNLHLTLLTSSIGIGACLLLQSHSVSRIPRWTSARGITGPSQPCSRNLLPT